MFQGIFIILSSKPNLYGNRKHAMQYFSAYGKKPIQGRIPTDCIYDGNNDPFKDAGIFYIQKELPIKEWERMCGTWGTFSHSADAGTWVELLGVPSQFSK